MMIDYILEYSLTVKKIKSSIFLIYNNIYYNSPYYIVYNMDYCSKHFSMYRQVYYAWQKCFIIKRQSLHVSKKKNSLKNQLQDY